MDSGRKNVARKVSLSEWRSPMTWWLAVAAALVVVGLWSLRRPSSRSRTMGDTPLRDSFAGEGALRASSDGPDKEPSIPPPPETLPGATLTEAKAERPEIFPDDTFNRTLLMREVVDSLRRYAVEAGPDDPFAMTAEQIKAFESRGEPYLW